MNPLRILSLMTVLCAVVYASSQGQMNLRSNRNSLNNNWKPTEWLSVSELENLPSVDEITMEQLENMSVEEGATLVNKIYHLSQISREITPNWTPALNEIPAYIISPNGEKVSFKLNQMVSTLKQLPYFGNEEVTIYITGMPEQRSETVKKATRKLVQAYWQRYNMQQQQNRNKNENQNQNRDNEQDSSEEQQKQQKHQQQQQHNSDNERNPTGNVLVIDLAATFTTYSQFIQFDVERTGKQIGKLLVQLTNEADVPQEIIHLIGQGIGAHVAGTAARQYTRLTGHKLRRITALDPSKIYSKTPNTLVGLARGDAEFVDAIHTSAYGVGTTARVANVDFYPNGPSVAVPGADNLVEASMRAVRYFAESVRPGNERNFPAVAASSLQEYKNNDGYGDRVYMGIATDFDVEGDYILQVNSKSPFGKSAPAKKQNTYHSSH